MLGAGLNEIAVERELADQRIDLAQLQRQLRTVLQVAAHEVVFGRACFQGHGAGVLRGRDAILLGQGEHAQDAAHRDFSVIAMQALAESADVPARLFATRQQLPRGQRGLRRTVFVFDPVTAALLAQVLAQQIARSRDRGGERAEASHCTCT